MDYSKFDWLKKNSNYVFYVGATIVVLLIFIYRVGFQDNIQREGVYFAAEKEFQTFINTESEKSDKSLREDSLKSLKNILIRHPDLNSKYDAPIAQALLIEQNPSEANVFAERVISRTKNNKMDYYDNFRKITFLIENKHYEEALDKSKKFKDELDVLSKNQDISNIDRLYTYNLFRIPLLEESLGKNEAALASWKVLKSYLYEDASPSFERRETKLMFDSLFAEGEISLKSFIETRENKTKS